MPASHIVLCLRGRRSSGKENLIVFREQEKVYLDT